MALEYSRTTARAVLVAALTLTCLAGPGAPAARAQSAGDYVALLDRYASGETEEAVEALAAHDMSWVTTAASAAMREAGAWTPRRARAAVLVHTDAVVDGWVTPARVGAHLAAARRMADIDKGTLVGREFRREWLLVVTWFFQSELDLPSARQWLDVLLADYPTDSDARVASGSYFESVAWNDGRQDQLDQAVAEYRRVPETSPASQQARVRLGRSLLALHRPSQALQVLDAERRRPGDDEWRYLAWLFSAAAESSTKQYAAAVGAYERAAELLPACQTPLIGLGAVLRAQGRVNEAIAAVSRSTTMDIAHCDDPWWHYRFGQTPERRARLLLTLRNQVTRR